MLNCEEGTHEPANCHSHLYSVPLTLTETFCSRVVAVVSSISSYASIRLYRPYLQGQDKCPISGPGPFPSVMDRTQLV